MSAETCHCKQCQCRSGQTVAVTDASERTRLTAEQVTGHNEETMSRQRRRQSELHSHGYTLAVDQPTGKHRQIHIDTNLICGQQQYSQLK